MEENKAKHAGPIWSTKTNKKYSLGTLQPKKALKGFFLPGF